MRNSAKVFAIVCKTRNTIITRTNLLIVSGGGKTRLYKSKMANLGTLKNKLYRICILLFLGQTVSSLYDCLIMFEEEDKPIDAPAIPNCPASETRMTTSSHPQALGYCTRVSRRRATKKIWIPAKTLEKIRSLPPMYGTSISS